MFCVTIHVVQSRVSDCTVSATSSVDNISCGDKYLGLLLQYHVDLGKQPVSLSPDVAPSRVPNNQTTISISSHSCSPEQIIEPHSEEIPDSNVHGQPENTNNLPISQPICDASDPYPVSSSSTDDHITQPPAERKKSLSIMSDSYFEAMSNSVKFPVGSGSFTTERPCKLTYRKYFNQRLLDVDDRYAKDIDYLLLSGHC